MNALRIVRAAIPDADDEVISHIVWARTCYPFGEVTPRDLYRAASRWRRAGEHKLRLCDHCDNVALHGEWMCVNCRDGLERCREQHEQSIPV